MKKTTLALSGIGDRNSAQNVQEALNNLSGVVAAEVSENQLQAYAYSGDKIKKEDLTTAVNSIGCSSSVIKEEYI